MVYKDRKIFMKGKGERTKHTPIQNRSGEKKTLEAEVQKGYAAQELFQSYMEWDCIKTL